MIAEELSILLSQPLNPARQNQSVRCPMHDDRVASLSISIPKGQWYCWGCGKGGGLQTLARFLGGDLDRSDIIVSQAQGLLEPEEERVDFRAKYDEFSPIKPTTPEAITYARNKGITYDTLEAFGIRHDTRGTLVMPYFDGDRVVALRYRGRSSKWYESGSERTIYNLNAVRGASRVILCEGESDTHSVFNLLARIRLDDIMVGGIAGANSSVEKWELWALDLMWADEIWIAFDADEAGDKGAERAIEVLGDKAKRLRPTKAIDWSDAIIAGETILL